MIHLTSYRTECTHDNELLDDIAYPQRVHWFPELYSRVKKGLTYVPHKLAERVMPLDLLEQLRETPCKTAFIFASGNSSLAGLYNPGPKVPSRLTYGYKFLPFTQTQVYAGRMAQSCGATDLVMTDASACASSLKALTDVYQLITYQNFDRVIVLSVEDVISDKVLDFFGETKASLTAEEEEATGIKPSAFDKHNYGFYLGQGAVFAVFESDRVAKNSHARLIGAGIASEVSTNCIGQREDGQGFVRAAENAFKIANIGSEEIQIVKTHGTGTKSNNLAEKAALQTLLHTPFIATSFKQRIGHTMGASGLLETCLLLDSLQSGIVPSIPNKTEHDPVFISEPQIMKRSPKILSLAAGMGNIYAAAIFDTRV
jgi:3-oxoacyl-(acyl-carrier-protein) synthase